MDDIAIFHRGGFIELNAFRRSVVIHFKMVNSRGEEVRNREFVFRGG